MTSLPHFETTKTVRNRFPNFGRARTVTAEIRPINAVLGKTASSSLNHLSARSSTTLGGNSFHERESNQADRNTKPKELLEIQRKTKSVIKRGIANLISKGIRFAIRLKAMKDQNQKLLSGPRTAQKKSGDNTGTTINNADIGHVAIMESVNQRMEAPELVTYSFISDLKLCPVIPFFPANGKIRVIDLIRWEYSDWDSNLRPIKRTNQENVNQFNHHFIMQVRNAIAQTASTQKTETRKSPKPFIGYKRKIKGPTIKAVL